MTPRLYTISALSVELDRDRRTIARAMSRVPPVQVNGREKRWLLKDAVRALKAYERKPASESAAESVRAFELCITTPEKRGRNVYDWNEMLENFHVDRDELSEWLRFGCPYLKRGDSCGRGWLFSTGHVIRWMGLWFGFLQQVRLIAEEDKTFGHITRHLAPPGRDYEGDEG